MSNIATFRRPADLDNLRKADAAPRCKHRRVDGSPCKAPALKDDKYCYYHSMLEGRDPCKFHLPPLEDGNAIQLVLSQIIENVLNYGIEENRARVALWAIQVASNNLNKTTIQPDLILERAIAILDARTERDEKLIRLRASLVAERQKLQAEQCATAAESKQEEQETSDYAAAINDLEQLAHSEEAAAAVAAGEPQAPTETKH